MRFGWFREGDDWYIVTDEVDLAHAVSAVAYYRITGQPATIVPDLTTYDNRRCLHVNVPQNVLPNGTEVTFWLEITMDTTAVVRLPTTGALSVLVNR